MQNPKILEVEAVRTRIITSGDNLLETLKKTFEKHGLQNNVILVITSKVVALTQGRVRKLDCTYGRRSDADGGTQSTPAFNALVKAEADAVIGGKQVTLTLKDGIFIAWAGIDRSNVKAGEVVLWPKNPFRTAHDLRKSLKRIFKLKNLGVIISDSCCHPLRRGVSAVTLGYSGFEGINDLRGHKDLFGNRLKVSAQAVADNLATAAHLIMGEAAESTPLALIRNAPVRFTSREIDPKSLTIDPENCLFAGLYDTPYK